MAEFIIRSDDLRNGGMRSVAESMILLKNIIIDEALLYDLDLILSEALANVVKHAYAKGEPRRAEVLIQTKRGHQVVIEISDWGCGIDNETESSELPCPTSVSGRGIPLMTSLCDRVAFTCKDGKNTVQLTKHIPAQAWRD